MSLLFNGADPGDFAAPPRAPEPMIITHVGTIHDYQASQVQILLRAFASARAEGHIPETVRLALVGPIGGVLRARLARVLEDFGLGSSVVVEGSTSHDEAITWMQRSRLLLLFAGTNRFIRLSKMSEYLASGRPVLAFARHDSETGLEAKAHGWYVTAGDDPAAVRAALVAGFIASGRPSEPALLAHPHPLNRFTEAEDLGALLSRVSARRN